MNKSIFFIVVLFIFSAEAVFAQVEENQDNSINATFTELLENANDYQNYKVIEREKLIQLQQEVAKEIKALNVEIESFDSLVKAQENEISSLKNELTETNARLETISQEKDEISFLGIPTEKSTYKTTMWIIVVILILVLALFIYKYKNSSALTKEARENLRENEAEFEEYRTKALEKQQKLGRMLQDEKNKHSKNNNS